MSASPGNATSARATDGRTAAAADPTTPREPVARSNDAPASLPRAEALPFDGVVCFGGEDWWYHNRGHYDMQMMREISRLVPVLYVNSIGMRVPRPGEGRMFLKRVLRKLRSLKRGRVEVRKNFTVLSPFSVPGRRGMNASRAILAMQVKRAARKMGIRKPLVWVACPPGVETLDAIDPVRVVHQRTDRFESFHHVDADLIGSYDRRLKKRADLTLFCSSLLFREERDDCRRALFVDHGVDFDRFADAGRDPREPAEAKDVPRPRVGFVGGIDAHTFWPEMLVDVVKRLPEVSFVLVGACSLPEGWCDAPNVFFFGQRPYEEVADWMASCDVLIMPWNRSEWIRACNPVKLKEYLAVGRPVVSTSFDELSNYRGYVEVADDAAGFADAIARALAADPDPERLRARVKEATWEARAGAVLRALAESPEK